MRVAPPRAIIILCIIYVIPRVPSTMWVYESKCIAYANSGRAPQSRGEFAVCYGE